MSYTKIINNENQDSFYINTSPPESNFSPSLPPNSNNKNKSLVLSSDDTSNSHLTPPSPHFFPPSSPLSRSPLPLSPYKSPLPLSPSSSSHPHLKLSIPYSPYCKSPTSSSSSLCPRPPSPSFSPIYSKTNSPNPPQSNSPYLNCETPRGHFLIPPHIYSAFSSPRFVI